MVGRGVLACVRTRALHAGGCSTGRAALPAVSCCMRGACAAAPGRSPHARAAHLLGAQERGLPLHKLLCKLLAAPHFPDVGQVLLFVVEVGRLARVRVLEALAGLRHLHASGVEEPARQAPGRGPVEVPGMQAPPAGRPPCPPAAPQHCPQAQGVPPAAPQQPGPPSCAHLLSSVDLPAPRLPTK